MFTKPNTIRGALALIAAAALAGLAAPAALADPPQGHRATAPPDLVERLVSSERSAGVGNLRNFEEASVRPDDRGGARRPVASAVLAQPPVTVSQDGFRWGDAMIGAAVAAGVLLMAGALMLMVRQRRRIALS